MNTHLRRWGLMSLTLAVALLATACLPEGMRVPQSEFLAALERKSGLIAYLGVDNNIYIVDQSGTTPTQVTQDAHADGDYLVYGLPVWSPDGQSLTFAGYEGQGENAPDQASLYVAQKDGSQLSQVYTGADYLIYYYWAPDSQRVSFLSNTSGSSLALKIISMLGGEAETLDAGNPYYWTWAPDSHSLLVHVGGAADDNPQARLSRLEISDQVNEHGLDIRPTEFKAPAFSPDGKKLLVAGETESGTPALLLTDAAGGAPKSLTEYTGNIAFAWSPDSKRVAYISSENTQIGVLGDLTVVDPEGKQEPVTLPDEQVYAFFWSPDGKSIAYFSPKRVEQPTPEPGSGSSSGDSGDESIIWSLSVMDAKDGSARAIASFFPTDRFLQVLPYFDQYHQSSTIWSPDSKNLLVSAYARDGSPGIFVVAASGNLDPRFIADGIVGFWSWK
ncbi:MAG: hypothetical protein ACRDH2_09695 [Anaerolineales bacterium]